MKEHPTEGSTCSNEGSTCSKEDGAGLRALFRGPGRETVRAKLQSLLSTEGHVPMGWEGSLRDSPGGGRGSSHLSN